VLLLLLAACCCPTPDARAASLEEKLSATTDYVPAAAAPVEQLVELAQKFKLPMAVEWVERPAAARPEQALPARRRSVRELIEAIIAAAAPEHAVTVEGGLVRVFSPAAAAHPFNFLNIRLKSYHVQDGDLFAAEDQLRWAIRFTLVPQKYRGGYGGGYGHGADSVFEFPRFTLSAADVTIREVLNQIAEAQGNALWVVTLKGVEMEGRKPYWSGKDPDELTEPLTSRWHFCPLSGLAELADEQLAVDLLIEGLLDERVATIPVLTEHGLYGNEGGAAGRAYEDGSNVSYGIGIERVGRDGVALTVELKVKRAGRGAQQFQETLSVSRERPAEVWPAPGVRIRSYFEPRAKGTGAPAGACFEGK
jgi:hypothetical protein